MKMCQLIRKKMAVGHQRIWSIFALLVAVYVVGITLSSCIWKLMLRETTPPASTIAIETSRQKYCQEKTNLTAVVKEALVSTSKLTRLPFLKNFKNPCWKEADNSSSILCVPYVLLAGFPKSGTTDFHSRLLAHPLIAQPWTKEPHYWTRGLFSMQCATQAAHNRSDDCFYREYAKTFFSDATTAIVTNRGVGDSKLKDLINPENTIDSQATKTSRADVDYPMITLDSSASSLWDSNNWDQIKENQNCSQPVYLTADLILRMNPNIRVIVLMREPVERLYSDYLFFSSTKTPQDFHSRVNSFIYHFNRCLGRHSVRYCTFDVRNMKHFWGRARLDVGLYDLYVSDWLERLPRDRLLIIRTEDYSNNTRHYIQQAFDFLQLPQLTDKAMSEMATMSRANTNMAKNSKPPMFEETKKILINFYAKHKQNLAKLLDDDRFLWRDV